MALSAKTIAIIKSTAPVLAEHGYAITRTMYGKMLDPKKGAGPAVTTIFNKRHQQEINGNRAHQPCALAGSLLAVAENIDNLGAILPAVELIAHKHVSLDIQPEQYDTVGEHVLWALKETLGDAATPEIINAWAETYGVVAKVFIDREKAIMDEKASQIGGWYGYRPFVCVKREMETPNICSFYFEPKDGKPIVTFKPGQYIGLRMKTDEVTTHRNYSLSMGPDQEQYRITVKREPSTQAGVADGVVSTWLHDDVQEGDSVQLSVPCGDFFLDVKDDKPIVLISAGVGVTPIMAMTEFLVAQRRTNNIQVVRVARSTVMDAMANKFDKIAEANPNVSLHALHTEHQDQRFRMEKLAEFVPQKDAHYYFCGPHDFMVSLFHGLKAWEVPVDQIHFEDFGPSSAIPASAAPTESSCPFGFR